MRVRLGLVGALLACACVLAFAAASASAFVTHAYLSQFNGSLTPAGFFDPSSGGVATNQATGYVYVADGYSNVVDVFGAEGEYKSQLMQADGITPYVFGERVGSIAVDQATGQIYVVNLEPSAAHDRINVFSAAGVYQTQLGSELGEGDPEELAVDDSTGEIYAASDRGVTALSSAGEYLTSFGKGEGGAVAVDQASHDVYVTNQTQTQSGTGVWKGTVEKLTSSGGYVSTLMQANGVTPYVFERVQSIGVDAAGDVYVDDVDKKVIDEFDAAGSFIGSVSATPGSASATPNGAFGEPIDITTSSNGDLYIADVSKSPPAVDIFGSAIVLPDAGIGEPTDIEPTQVELHGDVLPDGVQATACKFEYGLEEGVYTESAPCVPAPPYEGAESEVLVSAKLANLQPDTTYDYRLVAGNAGGVNVSQGTSFATPGPPTAIGETFFDVGSGSATVSAKIDPEQLPTECYFEYGTSTAYGSRTPVANLGAGASEVAVMEQLGSLQPNTTYYFRVVAVNEASTTFGSATVFNTLPQSILGLPDGRVFERVSPAEDGQAEVYTPNVYGIDMPRSEGIFTENTFAASPEGNAVVYQGAAPLAETAGGKSESNAYVATRALGGGWKQVDIEPAGRRGANYFAFSSNLSTGLIKASSEIGFEYGRPPLSPDAPGGVWIPYEHSLESESYQPFITKAATLHRGEALTVNYAGGSPDFSEVFFGANDALTSNALEIELSPGGHYLHENLYESVDGQLSLVNVLPDGTSEPNAMFGAPCVADDYDRFCLEGSIGVSSEEQREGGGSADLSRAVSADGSRVFWMDLNTGDLYVREDPASADAKTVQISSGSGGPARFWTASVDGSKVFFTNSKHYLAGQAGGELFEYDLENGQTTDLTPGVEVAGVIGASENGEYVYYADSSENLNLWHAGTTTLIATLAGVDGGEEVPVAPYAYPAGDWYTSLGERTAELTPDGNALEFMSDQRLKAAGYPSGAPTGGMEEVYVYEAEDGGKLFCASCSPSDEAPPVSSYGAAAFVPVSWEGTYQPQVISDDGSRVFFDSAEPLVSQDTNAKLDVYEWERDGSGSCQESSGCIYLLSGGQNGSSSWLLGSSASGNDVFVASRAPLVPGEPYDAFAVYDARVGGVQPPTPSACSGTGCQGVPPAPPIFATPASVTFAGVGNFPASSAQSGSAKSKSGAKSKRKAKRKVKSSSGAQKLAQALRRCKQKRSGKRAACRVQAQKRYGAGAKARSGKSSITAGR
jgi:Tol biopolymer transport system component